MTVLLNSKDDNITTLAMVYLSGVNIQNVYLNTLLYSTKVAYIKNATDSLHFDKNFTDLFGFMML
jgi:hypothetical protein